MVWPGRRSRATWEFIREQGGRLWVEFLPAYAPELNPVEYRALLDHNGNCLKWTRRVAPDPAQPDRG